MIRSKPCLRCARSALLLVASVQAACLAAGEPLRLHPENPRYFLWRGKPTIVITSGEHYGAVLNLAFDYRTYLDALARDGMNGTRTWAGAYAETEGNFNIAGNTLNPPAGRFICPWARSGQPGYADGGNKFDLTAWDPNYFKRMKEFVRYAAEKGVIVELNLFCPMYDDSMWRVCPMNAQNNVNGLGKIGRNDVLTLDRSGGLLAVQEAMVRKIAAELREFDNVYFEIVNEPYATGVPQDWQRHMTDVLAGAMRDWPRPFLISWNIANQSARVDDVHPAVSILNFHYATPPDTVALNAHHPRVIGDNETGFRGTADDPYRTEAWDYVIAGGGLFNHLDYSFTVGHEDGTFAFPPTQPGGGGAELRRQFRVLRDFIYGFDFVRMAPRNDAIKGGAPAGGTARVLAEPGKAYAIYVRRAGSTGPFSARWTGFVEPRFSEEHTFHTFSNDGIRLWVGDRKIIDDWTDHGEKEDTGAVPLEAGKRVAIKLEYFYNGGQGTAKLWWSSRGQKKEPIPAGALSLPDGSGPGLRGEYFKGNNFQQTWAARTDPTIDFAWGTRSPFSTEPAAGGTRLEIELAAGSWRAEWVDTKQGSIAKAESFNHAGGARALAAPAFDQDIALRIVRADAAANLLPNPSFETAAGSRPAGWRSERWGGAGSWGYEELGRTGKRCVSITSANGADIGWQAACSVSPFSMYRLSGWIKTENVVAKDGLGALFNLHNMQGVRTPAVTDTKDWTRVEVVFETGGNDTVQVNCLFGGWGLATGRAWYDDVSLELLSAAELTPAVKIDITKVREPLSPYIYGQFIEHLGRCIYGGIWAEMLEDRKFFSAVGARGSPWKVLGEGATVTMNAEAALAGKHAPQIGLPASGAGGGIAQGGLGLVAGKEYVGRVAVAAASAVKAIEIGLRWGTGDARQSIDVAGGPAQYKTFPFRFTAGASTNDGRLEICAAAPAGSGDAWLRVGAASLMPADNIHGMRADTIALLKELRAPIYRWPGGNFVSGYNWKDGIGDPDRRPPRRNPAWQGIEHNDFGIDEFMVFCKEVGAEPLVVVNSGLGDVAMALEELEYANGSAETPQGRVRAAGGHPAPYAVTWWGIGNEMYGNWQLGHMPLERYIEKHKTYAAAMRSSDPSVKLVAVGAVGSWSEQMLTHAAGDMDLMSEHFYCQEQPGLLSHVRQIPDNIRRIAEAHRRYRRTIPALEGKDIRIAMDEWNYWYGPHVFGELGTRYFMKDGLGIAAGLNEFSRSTDIVFMANYAQTVNVIGCIKTTKTAAAFETTGLALKMYRDHFGELPVAVTGKPEPLDVAAALTKDRTALTVAIVNPTTSPATLGLEIAGAPVRAGVAQAWQMSGAPDAYNEPGRTPIAIVAREIGEVGDSIKVEPVSATIIKISLGSAVR